MVLNSMAYLMHKNARRLKTVSGTVGAAAPTTPKAVAEVDAELEDETDDEKIERIMRSLDNE